MYKRNAQTRNLLRSSKSFTFITNLIHLLPEGGTQMQLNLSENLMLSFFHREFYRRDLVSPIERYERYTPNITFIYTCINFNT